MKKIIFERKLIKEEQQIHDSVRELDKFINDFDEYIESIIENKQYDLKTAESVKNKIIELKDYISPLMSGKNFQTASKDTIKLINICINNISTIKDITERISKVLVGKFKENNKKVKADQVNQREITAQNNIDKYILKTINDHIEPLYKKIDGFKKLVSDFRNNLDILS